MFSEGGEQSRKRVIKGSRKSMKFLVSDIDRSPLIRLTN